jgi:ribosomal protein S18 acetylase RimI-like enzyme
MKVTFKMAKDEKDIVMAYQIMIDAFTEYLQYDIPSSALNESIQTIQQLINNGSEQAILCFADGEAVGSVRIRFGKDSLYFSRLSVIPTARGKGIAKKMIKWLENYAQELDKLIIFCRVRKSLEQNIKLYLSCEFIISKEETIINTDGYQIDTVLMEKELQQKVSNYSFVKDY